MLRRAVHRNLRGIIEKLPRTLDETYERVLKDISEENREHARRLLHCLAVAIRPLRVEELAEILAFDFDGAVGGIPKFREDWRWKDQEWAVLSTCSSLITVVDSRLNFDECRVVQFFHFSVKEFLVSDRLASSARDVSRYHILSGAAHTILAQACLGFLLHLDILTGRETGKRFPLARYAAKHWVAHAQFEDVASHVNDGMRSLFDPDKHHLQAWLGIYNIDKFGGVLYSMRTVPSSLYYAALCGFRDLVEHLVISHPQLINTVGGCFDSPLLAALYGNHIQVAEFLLQHSSEVDTRGTDGLTPLQTSVYPGLFEREDMADVVLFLLGHGADVNFPGRDLSTPLHHAAKYENFEMVHLLLESGAEVDSRGDKGRTPLHHATKCTNFEIVQLLLESGAEVDSRDDKGRTPLHHATKYTSFEIVQLLLVSGAEVDSRDDRGRTSLHMVQIEEEEARNITRLLLERGANVNAQDEDGSTLLLEAAYSCSIDISQILLEHGAEPNAKNHDGQTPLSRLFADDERMLYHNSDRRSLAQLLLRHGANVNNQDKDHTTPLHLAMKAGSYDLAQILLEHDSEPNMANKDGNTALLLALKPKPKPEPVSYSFLHPLDKDAKQDAEVLAANCVRPLLEHGSDVNAMGKDTTTPVLLAIELKMYDITRMFLARGAEPNVKNYCGSTPLHLLLQSDFSNDDDIPDLARLLLDRGADVNAQDQNHATPLLLAAERHMDDIARILLERGADPNVKNTRGKTPLHLLLERYFDDHDDINHILVVERLLLERGADVNAQDEDNTTPLYLAYRHRRFEVAQIILDPANAEKDRYRASAQLYITSEGE